MSLMPTPSHPLWFAIIAPPAEVQHLTDYVVSHERPMHIAVLIAIVALFAIAWVLLTDTESVRRPHY
jgi:hypothetical protein